MVTEYDVATVIGEFDKTDFGTPGKGIGELVVSDQGLSHARVLPFLLIGGSIGQEDGYTHDDVAVYACGVGQFRHLAVTFRGVGGIVCERSRSAKGKDCSEDGCEGSGENGGEYFVHGVEYLCVVVVR